MKQKAKESFLNVLTKVCTAENIPIDLHELTDKELKELYLQLQFLKSGSFPYGIRKGEDFLTTMKNGNLQFISFTNTYKLGVRKLTFKEFLALREFAEENPHMYPFLDNWKMH